MPDIVSEDYGSAVARRLQAIWETEPGIYGWLSTVDHKEIGIRYIVTAFIFLIAGGVEALVIRLQLARPEQHLLTPEQYDELFSMHGITMILWYAFPVLTGFSVFLQPLIIGARDMAFPRLNAFTYWVFLFSGILLYASFAVAAAPNAGWFNYVPYAAKPFNPGPNIDFYSLANILLGISTTLGAINFVVTILRERAPGMSINRLPIMSWGTLTISVGLIFSMPAVTLAFFYLWLDRQFGAHLLSSAEGGQPLLWQHLFWFWGHPWVYVIVLPAISMISQCLPVSCRRPTGRLHGGGAGDHDDDGARLRRMGPPHVRDRSVQPGARLLRRGVYPDRHSERGLFLRLDRHHLDRAAGAQHRVPIHGGLHHHLRHRRRLGVHDRLGSGRLAADRHLFCGRSHSLCADRLEPVCRHGQHLITGSRRWPAGCSTNASGAGISG
jgi:hypothetical protein